ncbi:hypothetical protein FGL86_05735 [Pistricoccus aurantiacus]|uniref:DUF6927 domain-containing protein n=1 Tax=Pistricoccus aurantiacus TaxID=1883414 RepID=A0A5B8SVB8_9GAMM|nr:hypothetical protein [Pistricoccus aurantiacus]QEA38628.1 hypothetical protein FGL86_05735 [Pistricoccus aurantiacus]
MGWTIPHSMNSRDQLVEWLLREQNNPGHCEIIDHSRRGNVLYTVFRHLPKQYRFIVVFLLEGPTPASRRAGDCSWGYRDMDESMGPFVYDCPERLLRQSDLQDDQAVEWREHCRRQRRERAARRKLASECRAGDRLQLKAGCDRDGQPTATVVFVRAHTATFFIGKDTDGKPWRYRWSSVVIDTPLKASSRDAA